MKIRFLILFILVLLFSSCSVTKFVPDNKYLLNKVKIKSDVKNLGEEQLKPYLRQQPNAGIFGKYRLALKIYSLSGRDSSWHNRILRKWGEPPVVFSNELTERSRNEMQKFLSNKGYINSDVTVDIELKKKKANLTYSVSANTPYRIRNLEYKIDNDSIAALVKKDTATATIHSGNLFDVDELEKERQRITKQLRSEGYYYFSKDFLYVEADSALNTNQVDISFKNRTIDSTAARIDPYRQMKIGKVSILPWYSNEKTVRQQMVDSLKYLDYTFYYSDDNHQLKPSILAEKIYISPGSCYNEKDVEKTYMALNNLGTTKYVNITFRERSDSLLNCLILLSPAKLQNFSASIEGTNTDGDIGAAVSGTYQHKNIFHGAEQLNIKQRFAYQPMGEATISNLLSNVSLESSSEVSLSFPKFFFPFIPRDFKLRTRASTELYTSFNYQTNPWYVRTTLGAGLKYNWLAGILNNKRYTFDLVSVSYVHLPAISEEYREKYLNTSSITRYSYEDHFIVNSGFSYSTTTKHSSIPPYRYFNYRTSVETGGNLLTAFKKLTHAPADSNGVYLIGGIQYAQYAKGEFDFSHYVAIDKRNTIVYHANIGLAYPYGNADIVPFEKRFFSGGANSVRGWAVRTLGPGTYRADTSGDSDDDLLQAGDIKLDLNLEYRFKMFWLLEGALFADAGNIWTIKNYDSQPGGLFKFNSFYKEIALAYGLGLRLDFSFFVFRVDAGFKLYDPAQENNERWRKKITRDDFAFHFAIGYPF